MRTCPLVLVALLGCTKAPAPLPSNAAADTRSADALWALSPPDPMMAAVITPRGLQMLDGAQQAVRQLVATAPELAIVKTFLDGAITDTFGGPVTTLADVGIDTRRGLAVFITQAGPLVVLPVSDRAKLHRAFKLGTDAGADRLGPLTCKAVGDAQACALDAKMIPAAPTGRLPAAIASLGARGDIEVMMREPSPFGGVVQLARGAFTVRGSVAVSPRISLMLGKPIAQPDRAGLSGFATANLESVLASIPPGPADVRAMMTSIEGPLSVAVTAGRLVPDMRIPLRDPAPLTAFVAACPQALPPDVLAKTQTPGACRLKIGPMQLEIDMWVDGKELRFGSKDAANTPPGPKIAMTALGEELARGGWNLSLWGRGTAIDDSGPAGMVKTGTPFEPAILRVLSMINEVGFGARVEGDRMGFVVGVRTAWSNPDEVVAKLTAITMEEILANTTGAGAAIAKGSPRAPFAADHVAGRSGMLVPVGVIGILAAVAIPAFMDYMKKSKRTEAEIQLNRIAKSLKALAELDGKLPRGMVGPTPSAPCCSQPGNRCAPTAADWADPIWQAIEFELIDPSLFRYSYTGDGESFTVTAEGDLDCDGVSIKYTLAGELKDGRVQTQLVPPPPNTD